MAAVGPYELCESIGEGGMAQVFRALGPEGEEVAVKVLRGGNLATDEQLARFDREIRLAEQIDHPHLIRVLDHGVDAERGPWLVMPLVRGMTLRDLFGSRSLCPEAALLLLYPLVEALAALHERDLVHRDVKPENLMLSPLGDVTLVDLGLALGPTDTRHTREGEVAGSVPYMSPERIEGRDVDASADVWAFGVMLYELICGRRPFQRGRAAEEVGAILGGSFKSLAQADRRVSEELSWLVEVCLSPDPWKRPRDGAALLDRLRPLVYGALEEARNHRVSVLSDPKGFERQVAPSVTGRLREEAAAMLAKGDALDAIRLLDRALAYAPDDEETLALVEAASSGEPVSTAPISSEVVPTSEAATSASRRKLPRSLAAVAALAIGSSAVAWFAWPADDLPAASGPSIAAVGPDDASVTPAPSDASQDAGAEAPEPLTFHPIPPDALRNDDPPELDGLAAAEGEPVFDPVDLGEPAEEALALAVRALEDDPDDVSQEVIRVGALFALRRNEEGADAVAELVRRHPDDAEALTAAGFIAMRRARFDDAEELFGRALAVDPDFVDALRHRGVMRMRRGQTRDSYRDLVRVLAINPNNINALAEITEAYERAHRAADAAPFIRRLLDINPRNATAWVSLSIVLGQSRRPDDLDAAIEAVERGLALAPDHADGLRNRCLLLSQNGRAGAVPACTAAIEASPSDNDLFSARSLALARQRDYVPSLADADRAVELAPEVPRVYANRAIIRGRSGDTDGAYADLRVACSLGHARSCSRLRADGIVP